MDKKNARYYVINVKHIEDYIAELHQLNPQRTLCGLDLLKENIENNLAYVLDEGKFMIEIDHQKKEVTLLGDHLPIKNRKIVFDKEKTNESIYNTFMFAIDYAKRIKGGEEMIKEIKST